MFAGGDMAVDSDRYRSDRGMGAYRRTATGTSWSSEFRYKDQSDDEKIQCRSSLRLNIQNNLYIESQIRVHTNQKYGPNRSDPKRIKTGVIRRTITLSVHASLSYAN